LPFQNPTFSGLKDGELQTRYFQKKLDGYLRNIYQKARTSIEEMGIGTLYVVMGFLEWYESDDSGKEHFAPLVLFPVNI